MMRKVFYLWCISFFTIHGIAQEQWDYEENTVDLKYREDQFYFGVSHTLMQDKFKGYSPYSFSIGINGGFLRDFPINQNRTIAIAPGIGYSYLNLRSNFGLSETNEYLMLSNYKQSSLSLHSIDLPIELRWRTSTPESHKFWRVYLGFKASYNFNNRFKTTTSSYSIIRTGDMNINKWMYGAYASVGFNTWNFYVYYGLNSIYKNEVFANDPTRLKMLNVGMMFYIL